MLVSSHWMLVSKLTSFISIQYLIFFEFVRGEGGLLGGCDPFCDFHELRLYILEKGV